MGRGKEEKIPLGVEAAALERSFNLNLLGLGTHREARKT
jgi:hypothetical protein